MRMATPMRLVQFTRILAFLTLVRGFDIHVQIEDDENVETREYEGLTKLNPPFDLPNSTAINYDTMMVQTKYAFDHIPAFQSSIKFLPRKIKQRLRKRRSNTCFKHGKFTELKTASLVENGERVTLDCNECEEPMDAMLHSSHWLKFDPVPDENGIFHLEEVELDMNDDEDRNRVVETLEHSLVISRTNLSDTGSYICWRFGEEGQFQSTDMNIYQLNIWLQTAGNIESIYHIDVFDFNQGPFVEVSEGNHPPTDKLQDMNLELYNQWQPWGECDLCGVTGTRRRMSVCFVRHLNKTKRIPNDYIESLLEGAKLGIPCRSQFLSHVEELSTHLNRAYEIEFQPCLEESCGPGFGSAHGGKTKRANLEVLNNEDRKKKTDIKAVENHFLALKCKGAKYKSNAHWVKDGRVLSRIKLRKDTNNSTFIDLGSSLIFTRLNMSDSGWYACWINRSLAVRYKLKVILDENVALMHWLGCLFEVQAVSASIFTILMTVYYGCRMTRTKRQKTNSKSSKSSSSASQSSQSSQSSSSKSPRSTISSKSNSGSTNIGRVASSVGLSTGETSNSSDKNEVKQTDNSSKVLAAKS